MPYRIQYTALLLALALALGGSYSRFPDTRQLQDILELVQQKSSLDPRMTYFTVKAAVEGKRVVLSGQVSDSEQKLILFAGFQQLSLPIIDRVEVFPFREVANPYGMVHLKSANVYDRPGTGQLLTQFLLGTLVRVFKAEGDWLLVQNAADQYIAWIFRQDVLPMTAGTYEKLLQWDTLQVSRKESQIYDTPELSTGQVSVLLATRLPVIGVEEKAYKVFFPDKDRMRIGYLPQSDARLYVPGVPDTQTLLAHALQFKDTPYMAGGNTIQQWDSSGFMQTLFALHGYQLPREWRQQRRIAAPVYHRSNLKPGDLIFLPEEVGLYLGQQKLILASPRHGRTLVASFNPTDQEYDPFLQEQFLNGGRLSFVP